MSKNIGKKGCIGKNKGKSLEFKSLVWSGLFAFLGKTKTELVLKISEIDRTSPELVKTTQDH